MDSNKDSTQSSFREKMLEHKFLSELYEHLWFNNKFDIEVIRPEVDNAGYDLVFSSKAKTTYVQLKTRKQGGSTKTYKIHKKIFEKANAGVLLIEYEEVQRGIKVKYHYIDLSNVDENTIETAKRTTPDADGKYPERPDIKVLPLNHTEWNISISINTFIEKMSLHPTSQDL